MSGKINPPAHSGHLSPRTRSQSTLTTTEASPTPCDSTLLNVTKSDPSWQSAGGGNWNFTGSSVVKGDFSRYGADAPSYQYRQLIRGQMGYYVGDTFLPANPFVYNGPTPHPPYKVVSSTTDQEDGCGTYGAWRYGHRNETQHCTDDYYDDSGFAKVDRPSGPYYKGTDAPGFTNVHGGSGFVYLVDLHFTGKVVKVNADGSETLICRITWTMYRKLTVPS